MGELWSASSTSGSQRWHEVLEGYRGRQNNGPLPAVVRDVMTEAESERCHAAYLEDVW